MSYRLPRRVIVAAALLSVVAASFAAQTPVFAAEGKRAPKEKAKAKPTAAPVEDFTLPVSGRVIATIDNEPITLRDLEEYSRNSGITPVPSTGSTEFSKLYEEFLLQLLVEKEAKSLNLAVSNEDVDAYINEVKNQNQFDDERLAELLKSKGISLQGYRKQIREEILRSRLTQQHARQTVNVSDQDIRKELGLATTESSEVEHLWQVFVPFEDDGAGNEYRLADSPASSSAEGAREKRRELIDKIHSDSATVQELKSHGGTYFSDLGPVNAEDLLPELRSAVADLSLGDVSDVVETEKGYYLFGLASVQAASETLTDDMREKTRRQLLEGKLRAEMENYIMKELPKRYNLERKL